MHVISDLSPTDQERTGSQSCTKENCSVPSILKVIGMPAKESESFDLEKKVKDGSDSDNLKAQCEIILPSSCSVLHVENEGKVSVHLENEKGSRSGSTDLIKSMPLENSPEMSPKHCSPTTQPDSSFIGSIKFAAQEHNATTIILAASSELIEHERVQQAVAAPPIFDVDESTVLASEEPHSSVSSPIVLQVSEPVEHAAREHDSSTNAQHVLGASVSVEQTTEKHNATLSGVCESLAHYRNDKSSASSLSSSDNRHGDRKSVV